MSEVQSGGEALGQSLEAFREPTLRERPHRWSTIVSTLVVVVTLTLRKADSRTPEGLDVET